MVARISLDRSIWQHDCARRSRHGYNLSYSDFR
jgi:hypothetical protein